MSELRRAFLPDGTRIITDGHWSVKLGGSAGRFWAQPAEHTSAYRQHFKTSKAAVVWAEEYLSRRLKNEPAAELCSELPDCLTEQSAPLHTITVPASEYLALVEAALESDLFVSCEGCGAWLDRERDEISTDEVVGCWFYVGGRSEDAKACRRHRGDALAAAKVDFDKQREGGP